MLIDQAIEIVDAFDADGEVFVAIWSVALAKRLTFRLEAGAALAPEVVCSAFDAAALYWDDVCREAHLVALPQTAAGEVQVIPLAKSAEALSAAAAG